MSYDAVFISLLQDGRQTPNNVLAHAFGQTWTNFQVELFLFLDDYLCFLLRRACRLKRRLCGQRIDRLLRLKLVVVCLTHKAANMRCHRHC